jgi:branched-subunit amino acid transport protein AzlD
MIDRNYAFIIIFIIALITFLLRLIPFIFFSGDKKIPNFIEYIGTVLPYSIIGLLVIYCFQSTKFDVSPFGIPEVVAGTLVLIVHLFKRNTLLSIGSGTIVYMFLVQNLFI